MSEAVVTVYTPLHRPRPRGNARWTMGHGRKPLSSKGRRASATLWRSSSNPLSLSRSALHSLTVPASGIRA